MDYHWILRGFVTSIKQDQYGRAIAEIDFGVITINGAPHISGVLSLEGEPGMEGEMFGIRLKPGGRLYQVGTSIEFLLG